MIIGATITMAFFFAYTQVRSNAENTGFTCAISFCLVSSALRLPFPLLQVAQITQPNKKNIASRQEHPPHSWTSTFGFLVSISHVWVASLSQRRWMYPRRSNTSASGRSGFAVKTALSGWRAYSHVDRACSTASTTPYNFESSFLCGLEDWSQ
jgi:hypothetical protein